MIRRNEGHSWEALVALELDKCQNTKKLVERNHRSK